MVDHVVNYSSSDNLLEFLSDLGVPAFLADRENLIYSFNRTASHLEKIIGRSLLGMSLRELLPSVSFSGTNGYPAMDGHIEFHGKNFKVRFMPVNNGHVAMLLPSQSREELEKELAEARETLFDLDAAFNFSYDGIFITDGNAVGLRINESYSRVTGIENAQDMVGMTMQEAVKQGIVSESVSLLVLKNRKAMSTRPKVSSGKEILMTGTPVFNDEGEIVRVISNVRDISELLKLNKELEEVRQQSERYYSELLHLRSQQMSIGDCIANSLPMRKVVETALKISETDLAVLITGASGVGKEVVARLIHNHSNRRKSPFIKINCGAIPENLLESELFGYERGAFTNASTRGKVGLFELAENGTLFLDEIGELPLSLQVKLLGVLQDLKFMRIGGTEEKRLNARVLAATNQNLEKMIEEKKFRSDLFYRLCVASIHVPTLAERKDDIFPLIQFFLNRFNKHYKTEKSLSSQVIDVLTAYHWPGNVRQLCHVLEQSVALSEDTQISVDSMPNEIRAHVSASLSPVMTEKKSLSSILGEVEAEVFGKLLKQGWSTYKIAKELGISQATAVRKIQRMSKHK